MRRGEPWRGAGGNVTWCVMFSHPRRSFMVFDCGLEVITSRDKQIESKRESVRKKVQTRCRCWPDKGLFIGWSPSSLRFTEHSPRFALGARDVGLVSDNPMRSIPAFEKFRAL